MIYLKVWTSTRGFRAGPLVNGPLTGTMSKRAKIGITLEQLLFGFLPIKTVPIIVVAILMALAIWYVLIPFFLQVVLGKLPTVEDLYDHEDGSSHIYGHGPMASGNGLYNPSYSIGHGGRESSSSKNSSPKSSPKANKYLYSKRNY